MNTIFVTGVAGFIGSSFPRIVKSKNTKIISLDKLTYAGHLENIKDISPEILEFIQGDIGDSEKVSWILKKYCPMSIINFAAESHVDNSITGPKEFINTNILGVFNLLESSRSYWHTLNDVQKSQFRFIQVSTDEVFGSLSMSDPKFTELSSYLPNSPYSASKASADHLVRSWFHTYKFPTIITNCSNNYGPRQFPEKLIPKLVLNALKEKDLPIYGAGLNVRDWIHVEDHCQGIWSALINGKPGESYCFGGNSERKNIEVAHSICDILDELKPRQMGSYRNLIKFVEDRAGHDFRYAIDDTKAQKELGYKRQYLQFEDGLKHTIKWYLENSHWVSQIENKK